MKKFTRCYFLLVVFSILLNLSFKSYGQHSTSEHSLNLRDTINFPISQGITPGRLHQLYIDSATFQALCCEKIVFSFVFINSDTLKMDGWSFEKNEQVDFEDNPDLFLKVGKATTQTYEIGTYFGSLVLKKVEKIKRILKNRGKKFVVFVPKRIGTIIEYDVLVTNDDPRITIAEESTLAAIPTNVKLNPSPPRKW